MSTPTIDTAIAAYRAAETTEDRLLAREAIEQHIAADTPEGGDYEAATAELVERLDRERVPNEPTCGVFEDERCKVPVEDEATLPDVFFHRVDERLTRYWYQGQETYEAHERDEDEHGRTRWIGCRTFRFEDDTTVEEFLETEAAD
ncbi:hypothetical protein [Methylobacterium mesophilicum]